MIHVSNEVWLPVKGFEELYEVSNFGNVRSRDKITRDGRFWRGRELGKHDAGSGYHQVILSVDGVYYRRYVHRVVAEAFIPNNGMKPEVNHKDGNKHNNVVSNLEWVTKSENGLHTVRVLGRKPAFKGPFKPGANRKFTDEQVREIRKDVRSQKVIAAEYGVEQTTISAIKRRKNYKYVV